MNPHKEHVTRFGNQERLMGGSKLEHIGWDPLDKRNGEVAPVRAGKVSGCGKNSRRSIPERTNLAGEH